MSNFFNDGRTDLPLRKLDILVWCPSSKSDNCEWRRAILDNAVLGPYPPPGGVPLGGGMHWELVYDAACPKIGDYPYWISADVLEPMRRLEALLDHTFGNRWQEYMFAGEDARKRDGRRVVPLACGGGWRRVEAGDNSYFVPTGDV